MCHVYLGSHYSHFWWGWNEMGNPFMAGLKMVLEDLVARWRSVGLGQKQLPLFLLHRRSGLSAGLFFFPAIIWYFLKPHLLYHVSPKPLLILFINPWPNLDTIQKVCFPSEGINLDFSPDLMLLEHYNELFFPPEKKLPTLWHGHCDHGITEAVVIYTHELRDISPWVGLLVVHSCWGKGRHFLQ